jgi:hypothetical protein
MNIIVQSKAFFAEKKNSGRKHLAVTRFVQIWRAC